MTNSRASIPQGPAAAMARSCDAVRAVRALPAKGRLVAGDAAPPVALRTILGADVQVPDPGGRLVHLQFLRFANCPICNLHVQTYIKRIDELRDAGVREIVLFHSEARHLTDHHAAFPFGVVADPKKIHFAAYRVERSAFAVLSRRAWPSLIAGYRLRASGRPDSSTFGLPAEFLIGADGRIVDCHYGAYAADQWPVDTVLDLAKANRP